MTPYSISLRLGRFGTVEPSKMLRLLPVVMSQSSFVGRGRPRERKWANDKGRGSPEQVGPIRYLLRLGKLATSK